MKNLHKILYILFSCKLIVTTITCDSLFSHRGNMTCDTCELFTWLFRLKHRYELNRHFTHTSKIVHANTLCGSLNYSSVTNVKGIEHTHREDHRTFQKFYQRGWFQSDIDVSRRWQWTWKHKGQLIEFSRMFHQSGQLYTQSDVPE